MSQELPKAYDPALIEEKWAKFWAEAHLFDTPDPSELAAYLKAPSAAAESPRPGVFVQLLPPPNVTGRLHMGHMLNQTEMDILTRWHRMLGDTALWVPGTDHAGIATQMMVERQLAAEGQTTRQKLGREAFVDRVWQWKQQYGSAIKDQMRRLGASVDWSREYFTMDERLSRAVKEAFIRLWKQGLIYRGTYIVNWDPQIQTAVSDLEVTHEERPGKLYLVRYKLAGSVPGGGQVHGDSAGSVVIATTRPETMLGDVAVAVSPQDTRYMDLIGKTLILPLSGLNGQPEREIPIIADDWANPEFGTGAVKITPAHDPNDFAVGQRHHLPTPSILDPEGKVALPGSPYDGLDRFEARTRIVADLEAAGLLVEIRDHTYALTLSQRTGVVIEPRLSLQWFLAVQQQPQVNGEPRGDSIASKAIAAVRDGHIRFTPEMYAKTYFEWMNNLHDWCISRQLWWGHRIPAWHCAACAEINVALEAPSACTRCGGSDLVQETDVLDTWFSSGLLPFTVFGWPGEENSPEPHPGASPTAAGLTPELAAFYPTSLLVTGFDILFFWVARMIMFGCHFMSDVPLPDGRPRSLADAVPFREVYIHALVRDAERQKMSKTKGNVIDPIDVVTRYGTDAVRFTLASQASPGTDIAFSEARTEGYRAFANKIWNAARFLQMQIDRGREAGYRIDLQRAAGSAPSLPIETRWMQARLSSVCAEIDRALKAYRFDEAANAVYQFFWGEFCDWYLELVKLRLDFSVPRSEETALTLNALVAIFEAALRLLSPFMPFLTEELWHALYASVGMETPAQSIALTRYPQAEDFAADPAAVSAMQSLMDLIVAVRAIRKDLAVPEKEPVPIQVHASGPVGDLAQVHAGMLARLARVSSVEVASAAPAGSNVRSTSEFDVEVLYERAVDPAAERERLARELTKFDKGLAAAEKQLGSDTFLERAPAHIVEGLRRQAAETAALRQKTQAALDALPPA